MADASAELRRLERKLEELEAANNARLRSLRENYEERERKLRADYEALLKQRGQKAEEELRAALLASEKKLLKLQKEHFAEIEEAERRAKKEREKYRARMEELARENRDELEKIRKAEAEREEKAHSACHAMMLETEEAKREAEAVPHEYFFPRQMPLFIEELSKGRGFLGQKMYEAAAAIISAAGLQMKTLKEKTLKRQEEWETMYARYKAMVIGMHRDLTAFRKKTFETKAGEFTLENDAVRDFWCAGAFIPTAEAVEKAYALVRGIEENGHTAYLKAREPLSDYQVSKTIQEAEKLEKQLRAVMEVITAERTFSDERYVVGNRVADLYEEQGYEIDLCDFKDDNPLDVFEVIAMHRNAGGEGANDIRFTIIPERADGVVRRNRCIIWMGKQQLTDAVLLSQLFTTARGLFIRASANAIPAVQAKKEEVPLEVSKWKYEVSAGKLAEKYRKTVNIEVK